MVLSRFWLVIFISSIFFIVFGLFSSQYYSIDYVLNGKQGEPLLIGEKYLNEVPQFVQDSLQKSEEKTFVLNANTADADTTYVYNKQTVKIYSGKQQADGLLPMTKSSLFDLILPLMAYLSFFCGIMELLIISGASERLAKKLSPLFAKVFPSIPKNHESISYMTLNFAANFLGLDSAATPFGLKAMQSLQELNEDKDKASDAQIMFMCLHAAGLTLIPTSIIGYRAAEHAANPADVMLPCIITSFVGTIAAFVLVGIKQKVNFKSASLLAVLMGVIGAIVGLLFYVNSLDLIGKNYFTSNLSGLLLILIIGGTLIFSFIQEKKFVEQKTTILTGVPYSFEILSKLRFTRMDLPDLKIISQGGGKLAANLFNDFADYAERTGKKFIATYGQTEGTARMAYLPAEFAQTKIGSIGKAIPNGKLYLIDDNGNEISEADVPGEMVYSGPNVTLGYAYTGEDLQKGDERHGVLATGDIAVKDQDGFFYIVGRISRFLKLYGVRIGLDEVEQLIFKEFGVENICTGTDEKMKIYVTDETVVTEVASFVIQKTGLYHQAFEVLFIPTIPRNDVGKIIYNFD